MNAKNFFILGLLFFLSGCGTLYDQSFLDSNPPVYLDTVLGPDEKLSRVEIENVISPSPASKAGFKKGDRVLFINGEDANLSARALHKTLMDSGEKRIREIRFVIKREGRAKRIYMPPEDPYFKGNYGLHFRMFREDGKGLKDIAFVKQYVSGDGFRYDAVYNIGERTRLRTDCHVWGEKLLIVQFNIFNDSIKKNLHFDTKKVTVSDRWGEALEPLSTEEIVNGIYDVDRINEVKDRKLHWKKRAAKKLSAEINALHWELNTHRLKGGDIPPLNVAYGSLIYLLNPGHSPVTVRVKVGGEKFSAQYVMPQAMPEAVEEEPRLTTMKEYDSFFELLREKRWLF